MTRRSLLLPAAVLMAVLWTGGTASALGAPGTQDPPPEDPAVTAGSVPVDQVPADQVPTTEAPIITTTLPQGNGDIGRIIPLPNSGAEPEGPGDRGGWQQQGLFVLVCTVIVGIGVFVWWRSRLARERRRAAGHDPVLEAREHGGDVRRPRPPGITD